MGPKLKEMLKGAVKTGDFTIASGRKSNYYVNVKEVYTEPRVLKEIVKEMAKILREKEVDKIAGVALGAVPIAAALSLELDIPFVMVRKEKKGHGTNVQIEGEVKMGEKVIMVEDVVTTGGSVMAGVLEVREKGMCDTVIAVIDREEGAREFLKENGVELVPLMTAKDLLGGD